MSASFLPHCSTLRRSGLAPSTYSAYYRAVSIFLRDTSLTPFDLTTLPLDDIDLYVSAWIESEYEAGGSRGYGENLKFGLHFFFPRLKNRLHEAHLRLKGWKRKPKVASKSYPPLPRNVVCVMAVTLATQGAARAAVALLLSFDCYLRVNECMRLRRRDVTIPYDSRLGEPYLHVAVHLRHTKTLENMTVMVRDPVVARLLHRCMVGLQPRDYIFPFSAHHFRQTYFHAVCSQLELDTFGFVPHSLRHGGATHDFVLDGKSEEYITRRGRWASQKNAHRYVQTLAAVDLTFRVPVELNQEGQEYNMYLEAVMDAAVDGDLPSLPPLPSTARRA
jgi:integrase